LTWSADGSQLLLEGTYTGLYGIYLIDWHTREFQRLTGERIHSRAPSWSADGKAFVFQQSTSTESGIYVMSLRDRTQQRLVDNGTAPVWSPDGQLIAFVRETGVGAMIHVMNADGSNEHTFKNPRVKFPSTITWSPDSQRLAYIGLDKDLHILNVIAGDDTDTAIQMYRSPVWSTDASTIVLFNQRGQRGTFFALDVTTGEQREIFVYQGSGTVTSFDWRPSRRS
jgi:TolB protein